MSQAGRLMPVIPTLKGLMQEDCRESKASLCLQSKMPQLKERRAGKVAQWVKVCAYKSEVPSSIPGICRMENENQPHTVSPDPPQAHTHT